MKSKVHIYRKLFEPTNDEIAENESQNTIQMFDIPSTQVRRFSRIEPGKSYIVLGKFENYLFVKADDEIIG